MSTAVIGVPEFKARSGRTVRANEDGSVSFHLGNGYIVPEFVNDAEEFFQARNDARLGRWRCPENPDLVVYPNHDRGQVAVVDERDGARAHYSRALCGSSTHGGLGSGMHAAAHTYFVTFPAQEKPWLAAHAGEVWAIRMVDADAPEFAVHTVAAVFGVRFQTAGDGTFIDPASSSIVAGRKVFDPAVES